MKSSGATTVHYLIALVLGLSAATIWATDAEEPRHERARPGPRSDLETYSCDLREYSGLCRQYSIAAGADETISALKEGCESMPDGRFQEVECSTSALSSRCIDIVRDYHKPDVIYDNYYYSNTKGDWTREKTQRVCGDLGGEFVES